MYGRGNETPTSHRCPGQAEMEDLLRRSAGAARSAERARSMREYNISLSAMKDEHINSILQLQDAHNAAIDGMQHRHEEQLKQNRIQTFELESRHKREIAQLTQKISEGDRILEAEMRKNDKLHLKAKKDERVVTNLQGQLSDALSQVRKAKHYLRVNRFEQTRQRKRRKIKALKRSSVFTATQLLVQNIREMAKHARKEQQIDFFTRVCRTICNSLEVPILKPKKLTPEQDNAITTQFLTMNKRKLLKKKLRKIDPDLDIFARTETCGVQRKALMPTNAYFSKVHEEKVKKCTPRTETTGMEEEKCPKKRGRPSRRKLAESAAQNDTRWLPISKASCELKESISVQLQNPITFFTQRVQQLYDAKKITLDDHYMNRDTGEAEIWLGVTGDKGDDLTKLAVQIGNVEKCNSPFNLILFSLYEGDDSREQLEKKAQDAIDAINNLSTVTIIRGENDTVTLQVRQFLNSDMKFVYGCMNLAGGSSFHNCPYGLRKRGSTHRDLVTFSYSNDEEQEEHAHLPVEPCEEREFDKWEEHAITGAYSVKGLPLFNHIPPCQIIPSPMHVLQGASIAIDEALRGEAVNLDLIAEGYGEQWPGSERKAKALLKKTRSDIQLAIRKRRMGEDPVLEEEIKEKCKFAKTLDEFLHLKGKYGRKLHNTLSRLGLLGNFYHAKTGNQVRMMLSGNIPDQLWDVFDVSPDEWKTQWKTIMSTLGRIMSFTAARFWSDEEIDQCEQLIDYLQVLMAKSEPMRSVTPKMHILFNHVIPLMRRWGTWGKMSEQAIEALHPQINELRARYASMRDKRARYERVCQQLLLRMKMVDKEESNEVTDE